MKSDPRFLGWTYKVAGSFNEMGIKGGRKMLRSILDVLGFRYLYGEMSSRWLESEMEAQEIDLKLRFGSPWSTTVAFTREWMRSPR